MVVRVVVREGESIEEAVTRFKEAVLVLRAAGSRRQAPALAQKATLAWLKPSDLRRRKELRAEYEAYVGGCARRELVVEVRRGRTRRKEKFGDIPIKRK